jgi:hypothetical protein
MKRPARTDSEAPAPRSESERRLSARLRSYDSRGALAPERADADVAYALGHARGLEEGKDAHLDSLRTVLLRVLEARGGEPDDATMDELERASPSELQDWIVRAASSDD